MLTGIKYFIYEYVYPILYIVLNSPWQHTVFRTIDTCHFSGIKCLEWSFLHYSGRSRDYSNRYLDIHILPRMPYFYVSGTTLETKEGEPVNLHLETIRRAFLGERRKLVSKTTVLYSGFILNIEQLRVVQNIIEEFLFFPIQN